MWNWILDNSDLVKYRRNLIRQAWAISSEYNQINWQDGLLARTAVGRRHFGTGCLCSRVQLIRSYGERLFPWEGRGADSWQGMIERSCKISTIFSSTRYTKKMSLTIFCLREPCHCNWGLRCPGGEHVQVCVSPGSAGPFGPAALFLQSQTFHGLILQVTWNYCWCQCGFYQ